MGDNIGKFTYMDSRYYWKDGVAYPSVTTILSAYPKPYLIEWRGNLGNEAADKIMKEAAEKGSAVHSAVEKALRYGAKIRWYQPGEQYAPSDIVVDDQFTYISIQKIARWFEIVQPRVVKTEFVVWSPKYDFAGTVDLLVEIAGGTYEVNGAKPLELESGYYIVDFKTGRTVGAEARMQLGAYAAACEKKGLKGGLIVHTQSQNRKGVEGLGTTLVANLREEFARFRAVQTVWKMYQSANRPEPVELPLEIIFKHTHNQKQKNRKES